MKFNLTALFDDDTRAQIKAAVLGEARNIARSVIDGEIKAEIERCGQSLQRRWTSFDWMGKAELEKAVKNVLTERWGNTVKPLIEETIKAGVEAEVQVKLKNKTVFEAEKQEAYIRQLIKAELRAMLK